MLYHALILCPKCSKSHDMLSPNIKLLEMPDKNRLDHQSLLLTMKFSALHAIRK